MTTNLWLSPHGIWYFRKVYLLPSGKRKETKKSLRTRCKRTAKEQVIKLLACESPIRVPAEVVTPTEPVKPPTTSTTKPVITVKILKDNLEKYLAFKSRHCAEREQLSIRRYISRYLAFLSKKKHASPTSAVNAAAFIDSLNVAIPTKNKHASKIGGYLHWLNMRLDVEITNPFAQLKERHSLPPRDQRQAYTPEQAEKLVKHAESFPEWKKWVVLMGRYTGMRCNEICQLHREDIIQVEGVWCVSINQDKDYQILKTASSKRVLPLPIHLPEQFNIESFLAFVIGREGRLFPEATIFKGNCAHYFGKWFNRWRKKHSLPEFHSLRHLVATELKQAGQPEQFAAAILGHSIKSISFGRYGKSIPPRRLLASMKAIAATIA